MPPLQQLLRNYRSCRVLSHMQLQARPAQTLRLLQRTSTAAPAAGPILSQHSRCRACAASAPCGQLHITANSSRCINRGRCLQHVPQHWASSGRSSSHAHTSKHQHMCHASSSSTPQPTGGSGTMLTLPTILTLGRVAAIPALIAAWFWQDPAASTAVTALFIVASVTDWLDGYLARKMNASTPFGAFLDPVADKLMVAAVLILLSTQPLAAGPFAGNTWFVPVATLVIIGREISMSALREWAATLGPAAKAAVAVNSWGKWKTASQMVALTCLLLTKDGAQGQLGAVAAAAGAPLLAIAAWLTAYSLALYVAGLWKYMK